jgi:hypothetical protein
MSEPTERAAPPAVRLRSDRLVVDIAGPGTVYRGTRFDWTGFITQVTLEGGHTFCVPESLEPGQGTGGIGLCNEFGIDAPVGYDAAGPGEPFPKLGIGLLVRPDEGPYNFFRTHEIAQPFPIHVEAGDSTARYAVEPVDCWGYAARLEKTVTVSGNQLEIAYRLENVGQHPIVTNEYCHNFLGIDGQPIGPDYRLRVPYPIALEEMPRTARRAAPPRTRRLVPGFLLERIGERARKRMTEVLDIQESDIGLRARPERPFYCRLRGYARSQEPQWDLAHVPTGVGAREFDDFSPVRVAVWGTAHVISAEVFVEIAVQPGAAQTWSRRFEFYA